MKSVSGRRHRFAVVARSAVSCQTRSIKALFAASAVVAAIAAVLGGAGVANAAEAESFALKSFEAGTCTTPTCTYQSVTEAGHEGEAYTQADGHPPYGITAFEFSSKEEGGKKHPYGGSVHNIRVDLPPGFSVNPTAVPQCPKLVFEANLCPASSEVGKDEVFAANNTSGEVIALGEPYPIFNLTPEPGLPLEEGIEELSGLVHGYLKGGVSWYEEPGIGALTGGLPTGDFHEYFTTEVTNVGELGLHVIKIKQTFYGNSSGTGFLRLPSECNARAATTHIRAESYEEKSGETVIHPVEVAEASTTPPVTVTGCETPKFEPSLKVTPETTQSDSPDGATVSVTLPQNTSPTEVDSSDLDNASVTLPEGMTLNPSAAAGLEGCTPEEIGIPKSTTVTCPQRSSIGHVALEVPTLPPGSLTGNVYLGKPASGPITGPPYTIYIVASAPQYGVTVRLAGQVRTNSQTGRVETVFEHNPELPFNELKLTFNGGPFAPLANPLACGPAQAAATFTPYTGHPEAFSPSVSPFEVDSNGSGGACLSPLPFAAPGLSQSTSGQPAQAGASASFSLGVQRAEGQQYLTGMHAELPPGLTGLIPSVTLCPEAEANAGTCPAASEIGSVSASAGSGSEPFPFSGQVYLTEKYAGAPFGLSIVVPAIAGPFDLGRIVTRAKVEVNEYTAQIGATAVATTVFPATGGAAEASKTALPTVVGGIPVRLRSLTINLNRQGFERNPTNCSQLHAETTLTGLASQATLSSPFAVEGCAALAFTPSFSASSNAKTSRANGAAFSVRITQPSDQANIASVVTTLPVQLPSRDSTLKQACLQATFEHDPSGCPKGSLVGSATVQTPTLPGKMTGPAYLVSHGGEAFPDLDLVLSDIGVRVILVGHTNIKNGITTSTFASNPDVPITSFSLSLPAGPNSLLGANGSLCKPRLFMPTTITGQNGTKVVKQTRIAVSGCLPIRSHRTRDQRVYLTVHTPAAGRLHVSGNHLKTTVVDAKRAKNVKITVPLTRSARGVLRFLRKHHRVMRIKVRVGFTPKAKGGAAYLSYATVTFG